MPPLIFRFTPFAEFRLPREMPRFSTP